MGGIDDFLEGEEVLYGPSPPQDPNLAIPEPDNLDDRIDGQWYRNKGAKGYYQFDLEVHKYLVRRHLWDERCYVYSCYLYYHVSREINGVIFESPLSDEEFDQLQNQLDLSRDRWSPWFKEKIGKVAKEMMKAEAFMIKCTPEEKELALYWAKNYHKEFRKMLGYNEGDSDGFSERLPDEEQEERGTSR